MRGTIDGNEAAVDVAYRLTELCAIYPITPSSTMAELADDWASARRTNIWGTVPTIMEMQSEAGAAGAMHGALQGGAMSTTYTASQGLLLMIPNMYKIAGELTATVFQVAARSLAAQGLSIFGDHSDVMAVRQTGFALLSSASVQEAHDFALIAQAATLRSRVPFLHFFDGFRTSHEVTTMERLEDDDLRALVPDDLVREHRRRALTPERPVHPRHRTEPRRLLPGPRDRQPVLRPGRPASSRRRWTPSPSAPGAPTGSSSTPGTPRPPGSSSSWAPAVSPLARPSRRSPPPARRSACCRYGSTARSRQPSSSPRCRRTVEWIAVLDRTKEPGSMGEPLFLDVVTSLSEAHARGQLARMPRVIGGRYGLSSKEFTPGMVAGIFAELASESPRPRFTIGINDDVSGTSLPYDPDLDIENPATLRALFYGIGSDGTVGANKNTVKILAEDPQVHAQAYFVYDSKKSGGLTVSHLRFGPVPIAAPWLVAKAGFVGIHDFTLLDKVDVLSTAQDGATLLLNSPHPADQVWDSLPVPVQQEIIDRRLRLFAIDADAVAREAGLPGRTNTVLQACFFAISGVLPREEALERVKATIRKTYGRRGQEVVRRNEAAVDSAAAAMAEIPVPVAAGTGHPIPLVVPDTAPEFVRTVTAAMMAGRGESLPVSAMPVDGTFPTGTTTYEKRRISELVAEWDPDTCIQCGNCTFVCPHSVIRAKYVDAAALAGAPEAFSTLPLNAVGLPTAEYRLQVYVEDCTGCGLCVEACPVSQPADPTRKAINLEPLEPQLQTQRPNIEFFETLPFNERSRVDFGTIRGTQFLQPLFEFPGACAGCGETPYLKLLSQLFGERATIANATGCSSIYGGNLPTTPWTKNAAGRGPAWSNSLFEDNAEFGLGLRLAADLHTKLARDRLTQLRDVVGADLADAILDARQVRESELAAQRERVAELLPRLEGHSGLAVDDLRSVADHLLRRSVWIVGGDGWAYDIGSGGLDHVLATGRDVNVLVLDTEVYSNTGGQSSKSTPIGAVAKFAAAGKTMNKKDIALQAIAYGNVYVARVAMGADPHQTLTAFREAEAYDGPSLIIAYSHCIAHGYDLRKGLDQQYKAVASGHWPLVRYDPTVRARGGNPFQLDSPRPRIPLADYIYNELRYKVLRNRDPAEAERLLELAQEAVNQRWTDLRGDGHPRRARLPGRRPGQGRGHRRAGWTSHRSSTRRRWHGDDLGHSRQNRQRPHGRRAARRRPHDELPRPVAAQPARRQPVTRDEHRGPGQSPRRRRGGGGGAALPLRGTGHRRGAARDRIHRAVRGRPRGGAGLLPRRPRNPAARGDVALPQPGQGGRRRGRHPRHRQPQRQQPRRLDRLRPSGWRMPARPRSSSTSTSCPATRAPRARAVEDRHVEILRQVKAAVSIPVAVKLSPHFSSTGDMALRLDDGRRRRARALQPVPAPGRRPGDPRRHPGRRVVHAGGSAAGPLVDRHPLRAGARLAGRDDGCRERRRRGGLPARRSRRRHDRLRPAAARARARGGADRRPHRVAEAQGIRLGP